MKSLEKKYYSTDFHKLVTQLLIGISSITAYYIFYIKAAHGKRKNTVALF